MMEKIVALAPTERQGEDGDDGEAGGIAQKTRGEDDVAAEVFNGAELPELVEALAPSARIAEGAAGAGFRFGDRHAFVDELVSQHSLMKFKLFGHVAIERVAA
jgi:hypothetical protein